MNLRMAEVGPSLLLHFEQRLVPLSAPGCAVQNHGPTSSQTQEPSREGLQDAGAGPPHPHLPLWCLEWKPGCQSCPLPPRSRHCLLSSSSVEGSQSRDPPSGGPPVPLLSSSCFPSFRNLGSGGTSALSPRLVSEPSASRPLDI